MTALVIVEAVVIVMLVILVAGYAYVWKKGALEWE